jgi:hypothetical protein
MEISQCIVVVQYYGLYSSVVVLKLEVFCHNILPASRMQSTACRRI